MDAASMLVNIALFPIKLVRATKGAIHWIRAVNYTAAGNFDNAAAALSKIEGRCEGNDCEFHLLRAYVMLRRLELANVTSDVEVALRLIESTSSLGSDDARYLSCYAESLIIMADSYRATTADTYEGIAKSGNSVRERLLAIDLSKVQKHLLMKFPLPE